jgi:hypothetical protein
LRRFWNAAFPGSVACGLEIDFGGFCFFFDEPAKAACVIMISVREQHSSQVNRF